jgi:hypothetical protein
MSLMMTGHRRLDPDTPFVVQRIADWRADLWNRLERTRKPGDRIALAVDHLRRSFKYAGDEQVDVVTEAAVSHLVGAAEELLTARERRGRR